MPRRKKEKLIGLGLPANLLKEFIDLSYKGNTSIAPEGYEIDAPLSDSRVKVYKKIGSKEVIVTHRGSVGLQDWMDNAKFLVAGKVKSTKSYQLHRDRHLKAVEKYGAENIIGVGHSRAGLYLQELQKEVPIKEIITYNKAVGFYDALRTNPEEQTDVKVKNDFVSLLSGLQKRKNKMVEIDATSNPLDFNKAHQAEEISKLGDTFIGKKEEEKLEGSGRAPSTKTLEELQKKLKTLEKQLINIEKGKVYKTTNKDKVSYEISYTKARIKNYETKGEDLIITKKAKYKDELPAKAKPYKAKPKKEPKPEEPKKEKLEEPLLIKPPKKLREGQFEKEFDLYTDRVETLSHLGANPPEKYGKDPNSRLIAEWIEISNTEALTIAENLYKQYKEEYKTGAYLTKLQRTGIEGIKKLITQAKKVVDTLTERIEALKVKEKKKEEPTPKKIKPKTLEQKIKAIKQECAKSTTINEKNLLCILDEKALDSLLLYAKKEYKSSISNEDLIEVLNTDLYDNYSFSYIIHIDSAYGKGTHKYNNISNKLKAGDKNVIDDFNYFIYKKYRTINKDIRPLIEKPNPLNLEKVPKNYFKKKEEPKPEPPKLKKQQAFLLGYKEIKEEPKKEIKEEIKEEPKPQETKKEIDFEKMSKAELITYLEKIQEPWFRKTSNKGYTKKELIHIIKIREEKMKTEPIQQETEAKPAIKTKTMLLQEFENIILNKNADDIGELIKSMGFGNVNLSSQIARQSLFERIKTNNASKSKKAKKFNIEEFITRFNKENCEDLMCKYGINSKTEFRKWVVKNHPDKGGTIDDADFKQIINCAIKEKYCSKKEGGYFWDSKEVKEEKKARRKANAEAREAKIKKDKEDWDNKLIALTERIKKKRKAKGETAPKAEDDTQMAKAEDNTQMAVEAEEQEALGSGFYYLKEIAEPTNPIFRYRKTYEIPTFIDPETEFLSSLKGGAFTDMAGMNCDKTTGQCFNPVWEKEKIKKQILSEYKIWYNPFKRAPPGTILMAWLPKMIEDRYKPLYDEFVARRNVNIGLPADASRERFEKQMFSNLTDGLSYVPIFNTATSLGLTAASTLTDTKKEDGT